MAGTPDSGSTALDPDDTVVRAPTTEDGAATAATRTPSASPRTVALVAVALLAVLVPLVATLDLDLPGRPVLAVAYFLLVPGVPLALALRLPSPLLSTALAVATSLAVAVVYGTVTIIGQWWQPVAGAWSVSLLALVLSLLAILRPPPSTPVPSSAPVPAVAPATPGRRAAPEPRSSRLVRLTGERGVARGLLLLALVLLCGLTWWWSTQHVALDRAGTLGLLPVVGWRFVLAAVLVCALTAYALLRTPLNHALLAACAVLVSLLGYATVAVADRAGSVPVGWVHVLFASYIAQNGTVPRSVDARFSWPGFFSATAQLTTLAGTPDSRGFLVLASPVFTLAALPALLLVARTVTRSWRWSWVAVFVYLVTNWYQQDYFSPQATAFVIYTTLLAALLWMADSASAPAPTGGLLRRVRAAVRHRPPLPPGVSPRQAGLLGILLAFLGAGVVLGHQLTPLTLIFALVVVTVTGQTRFRMLWLVVTLVFATWFSYGATDYWFGHLDTVFGDLGQVSNSVGAGVSSRLVGDPTYKSAQLVRIAWSALLFAVAGVGVLLLRRRPDQFLLAGLGLAPFVLLAVQSYGGEGVIRSFLYAGPLLAPLAAVALRALLRRVLRPRTQPAGAPVRYRWGATALAVPVLLVALTGLVFTRGLNASFERTPPGQVTASEILAQRVRPGTVVAVPSSLGLTPAPPIGEVKRIYLDLEACDAGDLDTCLGKERPAYILLTSTQERYGELGASLAPGWLWRLGDRLVATEGYRRVYTDRDAWLLEAGPGAGS